jgi:hypothetical protein
MYWKRRRGYTDPKRTPEMVESITTKDKIFTVKVRRRTGKWRKVSLYDIV